MPHVPIRHTHGAGGPARGAAFGQFSDSESLGDHNLKFSERLRGSREVLTAGFPSPDPGAGICGDRCCIGGAGVAGGAPPVVLFCYAARYFVTQRRLFCYAARRICYAAGEFVTRLRNKFECDPNRSLATAQGMQRLHRADEHEESATRVCTSTRRLRYLLFRYVEFVTRQGLHIMPNLQL